MSCYLAGTWQKVGARWRREPYVIEGKRSSGRFSPGNKGAAMRASRSNASNAGSKESRIPRLSRWTWSYKGRSPREARRPSALAAWRLAAKHLGGRAQCTCVGNYCAIFRADYFLSGMMPFSPEISFNNWKPTGPVGVGCGSDREPTGPPPGSAAARITLTGSFGQAGMNAAHVA